MEVNEGRASLWDAAGVRAPAFGIVAANFYAGLCQASCSTPSSRCAPSSPITVLHQSCWFVLHGGSAAQASTIPHGRPLGISQQRGQRKTGPPTSHPEGKKRQISGWGIRSWGHRGRWGCLHRGDRSSERVPQRRQRPLLACTRRGSWGGGCTQNELPLTPTRRAPTPSASPHAPTMPPGRPPGSGQARGYRRLPQSLGPLLPGEPPPSGFVRLFLPSPLQQQAGRRGRPTPVLSRRRGTGGGRGCCGPPPRAPLPTACSPSRRRGSAFALRVRASRAACAAGWAAAGKRGGAEPGSPGRRLRSRRRSPSRAERERSERPGSGREQKGPALGRAREGGAWRGGGQEGARAASRFSGCGAAPQGGGRAENAPAPRPPTPRGGQWLGVRGLPAPHLGAGHPSALPSCVTEESVFQPCSAHEDVPDP
ncbi:basic salivary proline-rich protein 2-like [Muntiacus reevesi]|uniref:basic salivary proline-rich protein 2-like n=1 Tax=Muntiacus reevesi TaxID=9886 RepID=UPI003306F8AF